MYPVGGLTEGYSQLYDAAVKGAQNAGGFINKNKGVIKPGNIIEAAAGLNPVTAVLGTMYSANRAGVKAGRAILQPGQKTTKRKGGMPNLPDDYKDTELKAGQSAEDHRPGAGFPGQTPTPTGRETPAPDGGSGKGTQMSPRAMTMDEANSLLNRTAGVNLSGPFSSTQLPDTNDNPYYGKGETEEFRSDAPEDTHSQQLSTNLMSGSPFKQDAEPFEVPTDTSISYAQTKGSPQIATSGAKPTSKPVESNEDPQNSGINWGARTAADNSDPNIARRRAFLDAKSSLGGLRAIEAQKDIVYAGGQYNVVNANRGEEGQNDFVKISKGDRDEYMADRMTAEQLREKYMKKVTQDDGSDMPLETDRTAISTQRPPADVDQTEPVEFNVPDESISVNSKRYKTNYMKQKKYN